MGERVLERATIDENREGKEEIIGSLENSSHHQLQVLKGSNNEKDQKSA